MIHTASMATPNPGALEPSNGVREYFVGDPLETSSSWPVFWRDSRGYTGFIGQADKASADAFCKLLNDYERRATR